MSKTNGVLRHVVLFAFKADAGDGVRRVVYANLASRKLIKPEIANDPAVFPPEAEMQKMANPDAINNDIRRQMTRIYTSFNFYQRA